MRWVAAPWEAGSASAWWVTPGEADIKDHAAASVGETFVRELCEENLC